MFNFIIKLGNKMGDFIDHKCGIFVGPNLRIAYKGLNALQHRGREVTGLGFVGDTIDIIVWEGPVKRFDLEDLEKIFPGTKYHTVLGHVRYATSGKKDKLLEDAHPHHIGGTVIDRGNHRIIRDCEMIAVHNGQIDPQHFSGIDQRLLKTDCDTEAFLHFFKITSPQTILRDIPGSFTAAFANKRRKDVIVFRDRYGMKPGVLGMVDGKYCIASEDVAIRRFEEGKVEEEMVPGTIYYIGPNGAVEKEFVVRPNPKHCFFEWNYIANADSTINRVTVNTLRSSLGEMLAEELGRINVDLVTFLPRCPESAARHYASMVDLPFAPVFYKMRSERSFQGSNKDDRRESINRNLYLHPDYRHDGEKSLQGKRIAVIDDSTVRGNNSIKARNLLVTEGKVSEVVLINYTPPIGIVGSDGVGRGCMFGVDMPPTDDFIARGRNPKQINKLLGMKTYFLTLEGMMRVYEKLGMPANNLCTYCIGGEHPFKS